jgi:hypothetical protein
MFMKASGLQLKIEGQYTNNTGFVESTLTLQTHEIGVLVLVILPDTNIPQYESVQIHAYGKDVLHMCLLGHVARISLHRHGVGLAM